MTEDVSGSTFRPCKFAARGSGKWFARSKVIRRVGKRQAKIPQNIRPSGRLPTNKGKTQMLMARSRKDKGRAGACGRKTLSSTQPIILTMERRNFIRATVAAGLGYHAAHALAQQIQNAAGGDESAAGSSLPRVKDPGELRGEMLYRSLGTRDIEEGWLGLLAFNPDTIGGGLGSG